MKSEQGCLIEFCARQRDASAQKRILFFLRSLRRHGDDEGSLQARMMLFALLKIPAQFPCEKHTIW